MDIDLWVRVRRAGLPRAECAGALGAVSVVLIRVRAAQVPGDVGVAGYVHDPRFKRSRYAVDKHALGRGTARLGVAVISPARRG